MKMKFLAVALPALLFASAASGAELDSSSTTGAEAATSAESSTADTPAADADDRQICRRIETNTGSRVPFRRVCMTEREWRAYNRQN
jgi:long-subunit fatty acid transport protein